LKYGAVPIVRGVGGLVSTVFDWDYEQERQPEERNGFVFYQSDPPALESAMRRAFDLYYQNHDLFVKLQQQGMAYDYSWEKPAAAYLEIYEHIRA
jgi:starch synthase